MRRRAAVAVPALALAATLAVAAQAAAPTLLLPALVADPPARPLLGTYATGGQTRLLLRFDGFVHNVGSGPLDVRAARASADEPLAGVQRVQDDAGGWHDRALPAGELVYEEADGHHHWHLQHVERYSLYAADRSAPVAPALKVGFCLMDSEHTEPALGPAAPVYSDANGRQFCRQNQPGALDLFEGVSAGWRDVYDRDLAFQWVDVS